MRTVWFILLSFLLVSCEDTDKLSKEKPLTSYPWDIPQTKPERPLSSAMERLYDNYLTPRPEDNELYSNFKFTHLEGFDYNGHNGTISRRDPSKIIFENGKYYVWYTKRDTPVPPIGAKNAEHATDTIPSTDWDLSDIWYATSDDGFTWQEQGAAIERPEKPKQGWRSVTTTDILKWQGKYYLYFQAFNEASGKKGDHCPVSMAYSDSPNGPWTTVEGVVIENGEPGSWDQFSIHDPYPLVYNGKIYIYYKAAYGERPEYLLGAGLAIADNPLGPFKKHPLNPLFNSGHETTLFPFKEGMAALITSNGNESNTIQYAPDGVNFGIASVTALMPKAAGPFVPDAFTSNGNGRGITWGLSHFYNGGSRSKVHTMLARFDADLSLDFNEPAFKQTRRFLPKEVYFSQGLNNELKEKRKTEALAVE